MSESDSEVEVDEETKKKEEVKEIKEFNFDNTQFVNPNMARQLLRKYASISAITMICTICFCINYDLSFYLYLFKRFSRIRLVLKRIRAYLFVNRALNKCCIIKI